MAAVTLSKGPLPSPRQRSSGRERWSGHGSNCPVSIQPILPSRVTFPTSTPHTHRVRLARAPHTRAPEIPRPPARSHRHQTLDGGWHLRFPCSHCGDRSHVEQGGPAVYRSASRAWSTREAFGHVPPALSCPTLRSALRRQCVRSGRAPRSKRSTGFWRTSLMAGSFSAASARDAVRCSFRHIAGSATAPHDGGSVKAAAQYGSARIENRKVSGGGSCSRIDHELSGMRWYEAGEASANTADLLNGT